VISGVIEVVKGGADARYDKSFLAIEIRERDGYLISVLSRFEFFYGVQCHAMIR